MYILFAGMDYEQCGGAYDIFFVGTSLKDCQEKVSEVVKRLSIHGDDVWYHIYDVLENTIVEEGN